MDPRLLKYYNRELQHLREAGAEFAAEYPKVASRLTLEGLECEDPYVERLLEGFSFLTARLQLRMDAQYADFTQHLMEMVYPHFLSPIPSMTVVECQLDPESAAFVDGFRIPRDSALRSKLIPGETTACEFRTAQEVTLWPIEVESAEYFTNMRMLVDLQLPIGVSAKAGLSIKLRTLGGLPFNQLSMEELVFFLKGGDVTNSRLYEQIHGRKAAMLIRSGDPSEDWVVVRSKESISMVGYADDEALLPVNDRSFSGYRLLQEYFSFPERFQFFKTSGLGDAVSSCSGQELEIVILFDAPDHELENTVDKGCFSLFATPAINLFPKRCDRIHLDNKSHEYHVVPDRTRPLDFEVYSITKLEGYGSRTEEAQAFLPFYAVNDLSRFRDMNSFYTVRRELRQITSKQKTQGVRSHYPGSEAFLALVDNQSRTFNHDLKQLSVQTLCTNRDLPMRISSGSGNDFSLDVSAPVKAVKCLYGPTRPQPSRCYEKESLGWRLVNHLSLNYLSLSDSDEKEGAAALRQLLSLYGKSEDPSIRKQIEGLRSVRTEIITRRIPQKGPISFGRGVQVSLDLDEGAYEGSGVFLIGAVLAEFFRRYVTMNSFTETVVNSLERGEIMRWPAIIGQRKIL